jgi:UDP-glucuronate 4-epimerase
LSKYIALIEKYLGKKATKEMLALQLGDLPNTFAEISDFQKDFDFHPNTSIEEGIQRFISWYIAYSKKNKIVLKNDKG